MRFPDFYSNQIRDKLTDTSVDLDSDFIDTCCQIIVAEIYGEFTNALKLIEGLEKVVTDNIQMTFLSSLSCLVNVRIGRITQAETIKDILLQKDLIDAPDEIKGWRLFALGELYREIGRMKQSFNCFTELGELDLSKYLSTRGTRTLGIINRHFGELDKSLLLYHQAMSEAENMGDKFNMGLIYNSYGNLYWTQKNLKNAIFHFQKALAIWDELGNDLEMHLIHLNIGTIYKEYGDVPKSLNHLNLAYNFFIRMNHFLNLSFVIFELIQLGLYSGNKTLVSEMLIMMEEIAYDSNNEMIQLHLHISKAIVYINSERLIDKVAAYRHLNSILESDLIYYEISMLGYMSICELLLEEYSLYKNNKVLHEFAKNLHQLEELGNKSYVQATNVEVLLLRGKLQRINRNYNDARQFFHQAIKICKELNLNVLRVKIELELLSLEVEIKELYTLLDKMSEPKEDPEPEPIIEELPVIFFISNQSGITLLQYEFDYYLKSNINLISAMMSAMNGFLQEAFEVKTNIEKIKHKEFYVLFHFEDNLAFTYVYRKDNEKADIRFNQLIELIKNENGLIEDLRASGPHNDYLSEDLESKILELFV